MRTILAAAKTAFNGTSDQEFLRLASTDPEIRLALNTVLKTAIGWNKLPKGWTQESVQKFWTSLTGEAKHKVTKCIEKMQDKFDDPGAFCASLADQIEGTTSWRGKKASSPAMQLIQQYQVFAQQLLVMKRELEQLGQKAKKALYDAETAYEKAQQVSGMEDEDFRESPQGRALEVVTDVFREMHSRTRGNWESNDLGQLDKLQGDFECQYEDWKKTLERNS